MATWRYEGLPWVIKNQNNKSDIERVFRAYQALHILAGTQ